MEGERQMKCEAAVNLGAFREDAVADVHTDRYLLHLQSSVSASMHTSSVSFPGQSSTRLPCSLTASRSR